MEFTSIGKVLEMLVIFVIATTIHEFAHAIVADRLGDKTPRSQGRISLNPIDQNDPVGLLAFIITETLGTGLGWGKPVFTDTHNFRHPRRDNMIVAIAGPLSNLLQVILISVPLNRAWVAHGSSAERILLDALFLNAILFVFNLLPIGPLDGAKVLAGILAEKDAAVFDNFMQRFGLTLFILFIISHASQYVIVPPSAALVTRLVPGTYLEQQ